MTASDSPERSPADLLAMADHLSAAFFLATRDKPWARVHADADVIHGMTGIPLAIFNGATGARFTPDTADARIEDVLRPFREERVDMSWLVGSTSTPDDLVERLVAHGLTVDEVEPVLGRSLDDWSADAGTPLPDGLSIERVADRAAFHAATEVMFAAFGLPTDILETFEERYIDYSVGDAAVQRVYLARHEGRPVATALGFILDGVLGIFNVATVADHQRRGAGTAVTRATIDDAVQRGATAAILESSPSGRPVYERLGFRDLGTVTVLLGSFGT